MRRRNRGFALVAAIFLIVVLAALAAMLMQLTARQAQGQGLEHLRDQAELMAQLGLEWAHYRIAPPAPQPPTLTCPFTDTQLPPAGLPLGLGRFGVRVSCSAPPVATLTATAGHGNDPAAPDFVERRLQRNISP